MSTQREITYSTGETSNLTGASQKQIIYWENKGFIPKVERNISVVILPIAGSQRAKLRLSVLSKDTWIKVILWREPQSWPLADQVQLVNNG